MDGKAKKNYDHKKKPKVLARSPNGTPTFLEGELGAIKMEQGFRSEADLMTSAHQTLKTILADNLGASGGEEFVPSARKMYRDNQGNSHVGFAERLYGMAVEGAKMVMHFDAKGKVYALNGEFLKLTDIATETEIDCDAALALALEQSGIQEGEWISPCELTVVYARNGKGYLAWKQTIGYKAKAWQPMNKDVLFADAVSGELIERHPKVYGALSLDTMDCRGSIFGCETVSSSSNRINTGDAAIDAAHNYAIATYNFFLTQYNRDSIDDNGMTLILRVHFGQDLNQASWDGTQMTYGDGDGKQRRLMCWQLESFPSPMSHCVHQGSCLVNCHLKPT